MFKNYLTIAFRNIVRTKTFSAINIVGLAIGLTAFMLMALYIEFEMSFDSYHNKAANIYRVVDDKQTNALMQHGAGSAAPVGPALKAEFSRVKLAVRFTRTHSLVKYGDKLFQERNILFADADVFKIFDFQLIKGDAATALTEPMTIVLTEQTSAKYFGASDPIGKTLLLDGKSFKVTGLTKNIPINSHFSFDFLVSMETAKKPGSGYVWMFNNWYSNDFYTYILLAGPEDANKLSSQMAAFSNRHQKPGSSTTHHYSFERLTDIYLKSDRENQLGITGNINTLYIFSAVALFILLIACINFINLSTARAAERAKEIGIKKVNGVRRGQLILQFFTESFLMTLVALVMAIFLCSLLLPYLNSYAGTAIELNLTSAFHLVLLASIFICVGVFSGCYPALFLSSFNPVVALKNNYRSSRWSINIRQCLVVLQFTISVVLIISTIVVYSQLRYMQSQYLGFKSEQTLVINFEGDNNVQHQYQYIAIQLNRLPGVKSVTASSNVPGDLNSGGWSMDFAKSPGDTIHAEFPVYLVDFNFLRQYNIPIVSGRAFSEKYSSDTTESVMINEIALKKLGYNNAADAIGIKVDMYPAAGKVIGVFKDFHFESLQKAMQPLAMRVSPGQFNFFSLQLNTTNPEQSLNEITSFWKANVPERPLEYYFLDDSFNKQYLADIKFGKLFGIFTALAIAIACFGLFGLALFSVRQRTKEIGIRKVVGASVSQVTALLSLDFIKLVLFSIAIASPVAFFVMNKWIQAFAYRITIGWWVFVAGGIIAVGIAIITVSYQAIRAALANPVKSLRSE